MSAEASKRFAVTFVTPNQHMSSGGVYAIQQFARHCAGSMDVNLVVEEGEPQPLEGVVTYPGTAIEARELPPADALVIPADNEQGEQLFDLPPEAGAPLLLLQGYGIPDNPVVVANLNRAESVIAVATWLVDEAARFGCTAELVRCGLERSVFFPGSPSRERTPSVVMMTSHIDWKGTEDGLEAIRLARAEIPELEVRLFGHFDPAIPDMPFASTPQRTEVADAMRSSMILVCPSWEEGFGLPCVEAMLCGTAVATTDSKGSRDYAIPDQTAVVTEPRSPTTLAESIVRLVRDTQLRCRCVDQARQLIDDTYSDWPQASQALGTVLRELTAVRVGGGTLTSRLIPGPRAVSYHRPMANEDQHAASPAASTAPNGHYDFDIDLDSDSTHARIVRLVGSDRRVLELGPATGYMSRVFRERRCSVIGIELDQDMAAQAEQYCERVIVGDLEAVDLAEELGSDRFDVIVAADVLEHLKDPLAALRRLREFLAPGGFFVISLPNVAHGSVRLALLEGHFQYQRLGLLDVTHLRFFTRGSIEELLDEADLAMAEIYHQQLNIDDSEVPFDRDAVSPEVMEQLKQDPDAQTYQFVIRAIPFELPGMREMQRRMRDLATEVARLNEENSRLRETGLQLQELQGAQLQELQGALAAIASKEGQLRASLLDTHEQLFQRDQEISQLRAELLPLRRTLDSLRASQLGAAYLKIRRARRIASKVGDRIARYRNSLRQL